jgi:hypothetical protein
MEKQEMKDHAIRFVLLALAVATGVTLARMMAK